MTNNTNKKRKQQSIESIELNPRKSFTPGWVDNVNNDYTEGLPIKQNNKIIFVKKHKVFSDESVNVDKIQTKKETIKEIVKESESINTEEYNYISREIKINNLLTNSSQDMILSIISTICNDLTTSPETAILSKSSIDTYTIKDLLQLIIQDTNPYISEMAMLSTLLVFKDILPSYKINTSIDTSITLKKDTKRINSYEITLLNHYKQYINILNTKISNNLKVDVSITNDKMFKLGLSALRCQCELIKSLHYFNHYNVLLISIISYSCNKNTSINNICIHTINYLFTHDKDYQISYEIVVLISKALSSYKYQIPEELLLTFESIKLNIHIDKSKDIRKKSKKEKRQRRRHKDEVELGVLEANAVKDQTITQRYQVDCLHEICMIYFRIIKQKAGTNLLHVVLQGIGRLTHLINIDMVEDLIPVLKDIIVESTHLSIHIRFLSIHCVIKTLLGPGIELQVDDEVYIQSFIQLLHNLPNDFIYWHIVMDIIEMLLLKRRESRSHFIESIVNVILLHICHIIPVSIGSNMLGLINTVLLRYPKVRQNLHIYKIKQSSLVEQLDDDIVEDLAMKPLQLPDNITHINVNVDNNSLNESLVCYLMSNHYHFKYVNILKSLLSIDIVPIPYQISSNTQTTEQIEKSLVDDMIDSIDLSLQLTKQPKNIKRKQKKIVSSSIENTTIDKTNIWHKFYSSK